MIFRTEIHHCACIAQMNGWWPLQFQITVSIVESATRVLSMRPLSAYWSQMACALPTTDLGVATNRKSARCRPLSDCKVMKSLHLRMRAGISVEETPMLSESAVACASSAGYQFDAKSP